jgi:hypothetical protein
MPAVTSDEIQQARRMAVRIKSLPACIPCKITKNKCDHGRPCSRCKSHGLQCFHKVCLFSPIKFQPFSAETLDQLKKIRATHRNGFQRLSKQSFTGNQAQPWIKCLICHSRCSRDTAGKWGEQFFPRKFRNIRFNTICDNLFSDIG